MIQLIVDYSLHIGSPHCDQGRDGYFRDTGFGGNVRRDSGNAPKFDWDSGFRLLNGKRES